MTAYDGRLGLEDFNFQQTTLDQCVLSRVVDFAKFTTASAAGSASDSKDIIDIPAGFIVDDVMAVVKTASTTANGAFGLGDGDDAIYYLPTSTALTTSPALTVFQANAGASGKFKDTTSATSAMLRSTKVYTAAGKLKITLGTTAPQNGKIQVIVRGTQTF